MSVILEIPENEIPALLKIYQNEYEQVRQQYAKLGTRLDEIKSMIKQIESQVYKKDNLKEFIRFSYKSINDYSPAWTWLEKIRYVLNNSSPLTSREIIDKIVQLEPGLGDFRQKLTNSVPATISVAVNNNELVRIPIDDGKEYLYTIANKTNIKNAIELKS